MSEDNLTPEEQVALFNYDPFADTQSAPDVSAEEAPPVGAAEPEPAEPEKQVEGKIAATNQPLPASESTPVAPPPQVATTPEPSSEIVSLRAEIESLKRELTKVTTVAAAAAPSAPVETRPAEDDIPSYEYDIPDALVDGLSNEDPRVRKMAIRALVSSTGKEVHRLVRQEIDAKVGKVGDKAIQQWELRQAEQAQRERVRQDLFSQYPELNRPELADLLASVSRAVMTESGLTEWSPTLRDLIGNRVLGLIGGRRTQSYSPPPSARPAAPAPPPINSGNGARPIAPSSRSQADEVWDTLFNQG